jgi:hypothetical protein
MQVHELENFGAASSDPGSDVTSPFRLVRQPSRANSKLEQLHIRDNRIDDADAVKLKQTLLVRHAAHASHQFNFSSLYLDNVLLQFPCHPLFFNTLFPQSGVFPRLKILNLGPNNINLENLIELTLAAPQVAVDTLFGLCMVMLHTRLGNKYVLPRCVLKSTRRDINKFLEICFTSLNLDHWRRCGKR